VPPRFPASQHQSFFASHLQASPDESGFLSSCVDAQAGPLPLRQALYQVVAPFLLSFKKKLPDYLPDYLLAYSFSILYTQFKCIESKIQKILLVYRK
jgi:hypothetical protein